MWLCTGWESRNMLPVWSVSVIFTSSHVPPDVKQINYAKTTQVYAETCQMLLSGFSVFIFYRRGAPNCLCLRAWLSTPNPCGWCLINTGWHHTFLQRTRFWNIASYFAETWSSTPWWLCCGDRGYKCSSYYLVLLITRCWKDICTSARLQINSSLQPSARKSWLL